MSLFIKAVVINAGAVAGILLATVQTIILSRGLGPHDIGQYSLSVSVLSLTVTVSALGCPLSFLFLAKQQPRKKSVFFMNAFWVLSAIGAAGGVALAAVIGWRSTYFGPYGFSTLLFITLFLPASLLRLLFRNCLLTDIQAKKLSTIEVAASASSLVFVLFCWLLDKLTVDAALLSFVLAAGVRFAIGGWWVRREIAFSTRPEPAHIKRLTRSGTRLMLPDLVVMANEQVGILLLKLLVNDFSQVGFFSRAVSISMLMLVLSQAVMPVLFSRWSGLEAAVVGGHAEKVLRFVSSFALLLGVCMAVCAQWVVLLLYGEAFMAATAPVRILSAGVACGLINRTLIQLFGSRGIPEKGTRVLVAGMVLTVILELAFIPKWGILGGAGASAMGQLAIMVMLFRYARAHFKLKLGHCVFITPGDFNQLMAVLGEARRRKHT